MYETVFRPAGRGQHCQPRDRAIGFGTGSGPGRWHDKSGEDERCLANIAETLPEPKVIPGITVATKATRMNPLLVPGATQIGRFDYTNSAGSTSYRSLYFSDIGIEINQSGLRYVLNKDLSVTILELPGGSLKVVDMVNRTKSLSDGKYDMTVSDPVIAGRGANYRYVTRAKATGYYAYAFEFMETYVKTSTLPDRVIQVSNRIDGSITNTLDGLSASTQIAVADAASATEWNMPTFDFGDMATTALGAVNTGDIIQGVGASVDDASTSTTRAVSTVMAQLGGTVDTGALMLNVASNTSIVNGAITNALFKVNGTTGDLSTTALGAVNTGKIVSGVNAAVNSITGMGGASNRVN